MEQEFSSARTSINHLPALFKYVNAHHGWNLKPEKYRYNFDIGAGRFPGNMNKALDEVKVVNWPYDPFNLPQAINDNSISLAREWLADTVTISNVLCVIKEKICRIEVLELAKDILKPNGMVYISIYQGNGSRQPAPTRAGWQNNQPLEWYLPEIEQFFEVVHKTKKFIAAKPLTNGN